MPTLYLLVGYPGAGKTTVSKIIAEKTGAVHIWADKERLQRFDNPTHSQAESQSLYEELNIITDRLLKQGQSVIFDTNFSFLKDREHLRSIAAQNNAECVIIWLTTPVDIAKKRAVDEQRLRNGYDVVLSEETFQRIAGHLEPPEESENVIKIDGSSIDREQTLTLLQLA